MSSPHPAVPPSAPPTDPPPPFALDEAGIWDFLTGARPWWWLKTDPVRLGLAVGLMLELVLLALAWLDSRAGGYAQPLDRVFMVHVRCLVVVPVLIGGAALVRFFLPWVLSQFWTSGLLREEAAEQGLRAALREYRALREWRLVNVLIVSLAFAPAVLDFLRNGELDLLAWARLADGRLGLAGLWYGFVVKPLSSLLLLGWLWRLWVALLVLCQRLRRLPLCFAPTHPDAAGGLGFLEDLPLVQLPLVFAVAALACAGLAEQFVSGEFSLRQEPYTAAVLVGALMLLAVAPMLLFVVPIRNMAYDAWDEYHGLLVRHGQRVHARWIDGKPEPDAEGLLDAAELGPVADLGVLYERVDAISPLLVSRRVLLILALAAAVPLVPLLLMEFPVAQILGLLAGFVV
ncbi:MAG: hypothetical protein ACK6DF_13700 [Betaproteobacteria bacterium]